MDKTDYTKIPLAELWWSEGLSFSCVGCSRCCRGEPGAVWLDGSEGDRIAGFLGMSSEQFAEECTVEFAGRRSLREKKNYDCMFLERNPDKCSIYGVRPAQCSLFPFWPSVMKSRESWDEYAARCPGMNRGGLYSPAMIAELLNISPWPDL